tara:strand:+ start:814 stop:1047 length:234 start_codon:yes stop_codon:yes gene_type:complete
MTKNTGNKTSRPLKTRISTKKMGPKAGEAILRNKKEDPHIAERSSSSQKFLIFIRDQTLEEKFLKKTRSLCRDRVLF